MPPSRSYPRRRSLSQTLFLLLFTDLGGTRTVASWKYLNSESKKLPSRERSNTPSLGWRPVRVGGLQKTSRRHQKCWI
ncbi:hypothetical protein F5Y14DRAFT_280706 [Nemania sp. NC0429]|nr:hypothetical protein F5Y14DRAFT_280706 [Nemania sp. NC0429]